MLAREGPRLGGEEGRRADIRRQIAEAASDIHAAADGDAARNRRALGARSRLGDKQFAQCQCRLWLAQRLRVAVSAQCGGQCQLRELPGPVAAGNAQLFQQPSGLFEFLLRQYRDDGLRELAKIRLFQLTAAGADNQHALGGDAGNRRQQHGLTAFAADIAAFFKPRQQTVRRRIDGFGCAAQRPLAGNANNKTRAAQLGGRGNSFAADLHVCPRKTNEMILGIIAPAPTTQICLLSVQRQFAARGESVAPGARSHFLPNG